MARVVINGKEVVSNFQGGSVTFINGRLIVDGKDVSLDDFQNQPTVNITVEGNVDRVETSSGDVTVNGEVGSVKTTSGDIEVACAVVEGSITAVSGDVNVEGTVYGDVSTVSGDVKVTGDVQGQAVSRSGRVKKKKKF